MPSNKTNTRALLMMLLRLLMITNMAAFQISAIRRNWKNHASINSNNYYYYNIRLAATTTTQRSQEEVTKELYESIDKFMVFMDTSSPFKNQNREKMQALAREHNAIVYGAPIEPAAPTPTSSTSTTTITATKTRMPEVSSRLEPAMAKELVKAAFSAMEPKYESKNKSTVDAPKQDYGSRAPVPVSSKKLPSSSSESKHPPTADAAYHTNTTTTRKGPIFASSVASPTVTPIEGDVVGKHSTPPIPPKTVVPVSKDPVSLAPKKDQFDSTTVVPVSKDPPKVALKGQPNAKKFASSVASAQVTSIIADDDFDRKKLLTEDDHELPVTPKTVVPISEDQPGSINVMDTRSSSKVDTAQISTTSLAEDIARMEQDIARMEEEMKKEEAFVSDSLLPPPPLEAAPAPAPATTASYSFPPIVFSDKPDVKVLKQLINDANDWFEEHGNDDLDDQELKEEVHEMIQEMEHILRYATVNDDSNSTPKFAVLLPDSGGESSNNVDTTTKVALPLPPPPSAALKVSGSTALGFFKERISALQNNGTIKETTSTGTESATINPRPTTTTTTDATTAASAAAAEISSTRPTTKEPTIDKASAETTKKERVLKTVLATDVDEPIRHESLSAVDRAFKALSVGKVTNATPEAVITNLESDSTYVSSSSPSSFNDENSSRAGYF